ncbi:MAG TPA: hypothetical protein VF763_08035 [Candidatus Limnocylindrales bacterium]
MRSASLRRRPATRAAVHATAAVTWIGAGHALVARSLPDGRVLVRELFRPFAAAPEPAPYLAELVDELLGCERVLVAGPEPLRLALEREYVAIEGRPDRLRDDAADAAPLDRRALLDRLAALGDG